MTARHIIVNLLKTSSNTNSFKKPKEKILCTEKQIQELQQDFFFFGRNYQTDFKMYLRKQSILKNQDNFEIKHI